MIVNTLIASVSKYFTSLSVDSMWGYKKISLLEADDNKIPNGTEIVIDAATNASVSISKSVMQHSSESKKVYMDGTRINPNKISITGHIETTKLLDIQRIAAADTWMYVSMTKDMGGSMLSMSNSSQTQIGRLVDTATGLLSDTSSPTQIYADSKLYTIQNLSITDEGFINTVSVTLDLIEVVLFDVDMQYKYGVKQNKGNGGKIQTTGTQKEIKEPPLKTLVGG